MAEKSCNDLKRFSSDEIKSFFEVSATFGEDNDDDGFDDEQRSESSRKHSSCSEKNEVSEFDNSFDAIIDILNDRIL